MMINRQRFKNKYQKKFKFTPQASLRIICIPGVYIFSHFCELFGQLNSQFFFLKGSQTQGIFAFAFVPSPGYSDLVI